MVILFSSSERQRYFNFDVTKFMSSLESLLSGDTPEGHQSSIEESVDSDVDDSDMGDDDEEEIVFAQAYDEVRLFIPFLCQFFLPLQYVFCSKPIFPL